MNEVDVDRADFPDIKKFTMNILDVAANRGATDGLDAQVAYLSTMTHVMLGRKLSESTTALTNQITAASKASDVASGAALTEAKRILVATWALVIVTFLLAVATAGLVFYTRALLDHVPTIINIAPASKDK